MSLWFLNDQPRLYLEQAEIKQLEGNTDWLIGTNWGFDGELYVDATLRVHDYNYEVRMRYPDLFPHVPPAVLPQNKEERWSTHQYLNVGLLQEKS
jgi:hypothetical protein